MTTSSLRRRCTWFVLLFCVVLNLFFVVNQGAWDSDLGGDPDEAAHAVTSLMVRDYLAGGWRQPPLGFAKQFYEDFPKVALGHYPPGFYCLAGLWLLPSATIKSLLLLQVALSACLASLVYRLASKLVSLPAAILTGLLMAALPTMLKQTQLIMSDMFVTILCLLAVALWRDYLNRPSMRRAAGFGLVAAAAILTKGSAMGLCAVPLLALALTGQWHLLKSASCWFSGLPVALLAGPWMFYSTKITAEGMIHRPLQKFFPEAASYYSRAMPQILGWPLMATALVGVVFLGIRCRTKSSQATLAATVCAMSAGMLLIILVIPAGLNERYLLPLLPTLLVGSLLTIDRLCDMLPKYRRTALFVLAIGSFSQVAAWPTKDVHGFSQAATRSGVPTTRSEVSKWLVTSDPRGEGAIIAAAAFDCQQRSPSLLRVCRGSKELASSDWMGRDYQSPFVDDAAILRHLDKLQINRVFVDLSVPAAKRLPHELLLHNAMQSATSTWKLDFDQPITRRPGETGRLIVYKRLSNSQPAKASD